jgi:carbamoyl-phosphate synthase large subunit
MSANAGARDAVLVTGLHAVDNPSPGVSVARCLRHEGVRVIGLCYEPTDTGAYVDGLFDRVYRMPRIEADPQAYLQRLHAVAAATGAGALLPTLDPEVAFLAGQERWLEQHGLRALLPTPSAAAQAAKWAIAEPGRTAGFRVPTLRTARTLDEALRAAEFIGFPVMVKGAFYEAHRAEQADEIPALFRALAGRWGLPVLVQAQAIGAEIVAACLCDRPGRLRRWIAMRKFGMNEQGTTWCGVTFRNDSFFTACERLLEILQWSGPCEVEAKIDESSGMLTLLELNTRFPSWIGIATEVGSNLPFDLIRLLRGEPLDVDPGFRTGLVMVRQHHDRTIPLSRFVDVAVGGVLSV